jgi:hypothetical protein
MNKHNRSLCLYTYLQNREQNDDGQASEFGILNPSELVSQVMDGGFRPKRPLEILWKYGFTVPNSWIASLINMDCNSDEMR